jgi:hypothetical protein
MLEGLTVVLEDLIDAGRRIPVVNEVDPTVVSEEDPGVVLVAP